ncbi:MAG: hypothetical protein VZR09_06225 [Candidatus Gastranaerophilaceae bacterium]|nr:hypothetical protein [Candidatus Gastranaerophilaceae bacterium]
MVKISDISHVRGSLASKAENQKINRRLISLFSGGRRPNIPDKNRKYNFVLGERRGDVRIVDEAAISTPVKNPGNPSRVSGNSYSNGQLNNPDNYFASSAQGWRGDCYLLAEINAIRNTKHGQEILKKNVKTNSDGSVTVTLPGALVLKNKYKGPGCEITGTYTITKQALEKAKAYAGTSYSKGDLDVIAIEIAMENFHAELYKTMQNLNIKPAERTAENAYIDSSDFLSGGQEYDAGFILTGQKSEVYHKKQFDSYSVKPYQDGEYGYITREQMEQQTGFSTKAELSKGQTPEISYYTEDDAQLNSMLDKYAGHENELALTCSVRCAKKGHGGKIVPGGGHAITIVKITSDIIYISNPHHPDKIEPIPRNEFLKMCKGLNAQKMDLREISQNYSNNGRVRDNASNRTRITQDQINAIFGKISSRTGIPQRNVTVNNIRKIVAQYNKSNSNEPKRTELSVQDMVRLFNVISAKDKILKDFKTMQRLQAIFDNSDAAEMNSNDAKLISNLFKECQIL